MARLEALGKILKDRQETVLVALKHEREVGLSVCGRACAAPYEVIWRSHKKRNRYHGCQDWEAGCVE